MSRDPVQVLRECLVAVLDTDAGVVAITGRASVNLVPLGDLGDAPDLPIAAYAVADTNEQVGMAGDARAAVRVSCYAATEAAAVALAAAISAALTYSALAGAAPAIEAVFESRSRSAPEWDSQQEAFRADVDVGLLYSVPA